MTCILVEVTVQVGVLPLLVRHRPRSLKIMVLRHEYFFWSLYERSPVFFLILVPDCLPITNAINSVSRVFSVSRSFVITGGMAGFPSRVFAFVTPVVIARGSFGKSILSVRVLVTGQ
ncbi:hypothetical protein HanRHA438_Chr05g0227541 [Helianthus annuus]|nr:hypothetical protein HanRHA438_Chr05g0227541 [Helianthus annuus]